MIGRVGVLRFHESILVITRVHWCVLYTCNSLYISYYCAAAAETAACVLLTNVYLYDTRMVRPQVQEPPLYSTHLERPIV